MPKKKRMTLIDGLDIDSTSGWYPCTYKGMPFDATKLYCFNTTEFIEKCGLHMEALGEPNLLLLKNADKKILFLIDYGSCEGGHDGKDVSYPCVSKEDAGKADKILSIYGNETGIRLDVPVSDLDELAETVDEAEE